MFNVNKNAYAHDMNALKALSRIGSARIFKPTIEVEVEPSPSGFKVSLSTETESGRVDRSVAILRGAVVAPVCPVCSNADTMILGPTKAAFGFNCLGCNHVWTVAAKELARTTDLPLGSFDVLVELEATTTLREIDGGEDLDVDAFDVLAVTRDGSPLDAQLVASLRDALRPALFDVAVAAYEIS